MPPTPSSLYVFLSISSGKNAIISPPVESCKYLPIKSLLFPNPLGCCFDFELRRILAELHAEAANTTTLPFNLYSLFSSLSINETPVALPSPFVVTVRTH